MVHARVCVCVCVRVCVRRVCVCVCGCARASACYQYPWWGWGCTVAQVLELSCPSSKVKQTRGSLLTQILPVFSAYTHRWQRATCWCTASFTVAGSSASCQTPWYTSMLISSTSFSCFSSGSYEELT